MNCSEIDSFVRKFKHLWHSGVDAHLDVHTHAGQAWVWVGLRVQLGQAPGHVHPHVRKNTSPAKQRRRQRREAARAEAAKASNLISKSDEVAAEADNSNAEEAANENANVEDIAAEIVEVVQEAAEEVPEKQYLQGPLLITSVEDEFCEDEKYYDEIDPNVAFNCFQCKMEHFPANHVDGDRVPTYGLCCWHLGVSKCRNCAKNIIGLGVIRAHRQICHAPS